MASLPIGVCASVDELALTPGTSRDGARAILTAALRGVVRERPEREAALLLAHAARLRPADLIADPEAPLGDAAERVAAFARRRLAGEPLSRILGRREFWSLGLAIAPDVLDPRPETETIVEAALADFAGRRGDALRILDLGVGSGALLCALLSEFPNAAGIGVDVSPRAVEIANANLAALGLDGRGEARIGDWGRGLEGEFDLVVSNPPYVRAGDIAGLDREVRDHDPRLALDGGPDGLDAYRALAPQLARLLRPDGGQFYLEFGEGQSEDVRGIVASIGLEACAVLTDLSGRARAISGRRTAVGPSA